MLILLEIEQCVYSAIISVDIKRREDINYYSRTEDINFRETFRHGLYISRCFFYFYGFRGMI